MEIYADMVRLYWEMVVWQQEEARASALLDLETSDLLEHPVPLAA